MRLTRYFSALLVFFLFGICAKATTYTVQASGGGSYTSISACAAAAVAGDTCVVYAGSYSGWTQQASGAAGNPITFVANTGDTVTISGGVNISGCSYITISHFTLSGGVTGNGSSSHNTIDHNIFNVSGSAFRINDGQGSNGSDNVFTDNKVNVSSSGNVVGVYLYGDRNLIQNNELVSTDGDCMDLGGMNVVVRNNYCHDLSNASSGEHIDFVQVVGGGNPTLSFSLIENNVEQNCASNNCHFFIARTTGVGVADTIIVRYNYAQNLAATGPVNYGGVGDNVPNGWFYNNTIAQTPDSENGACASWQNAANGVALNNICYNAATGPWAPFVGNAVGNGNISYSTGFSGNWNAPYSSEATYNLLKNQNPLFANYPTDGTLQASSPAIGAGVALTTVAAGDSGSGTSLVVSNAHGLQPGWAATQGDWIRIGPSTTAQITAINYSTNTITLASSVSRSAGNPVYLYKDSSGKARLTGSSPDVGAFPSGSTQTQSNPPAPPTNLNAVVQ